MVPARRRCLLIGNHALLLDGLQYCLEPEFEVRAVSASRYAAFNAAAEFHPDAAIIDADAGEISSEIGTYLRCKDPELVLTYLTSGPGYHSDTEYAVSKTQPFAELLATLRVSSAPSARISHAIDGRLPEETRDGGSQSAINLSQRELQVLVLLVRGFSMKMVARELGITPRTVAFHKYKAMDANGLRDNADLMAFALRHGLLPLIERQSPGNALRAAAQQPSYAELMLTGRPKIECSDLKN